ncbi:uncharacterized protein LOC120350047 [Nilaparvata lugens]|uniref:uncharacterized protein LOC120350047 n=1 Tax=Nilaparvata lugens TaxID=108931 RepID=UPI00193DFFD8|nr:uncharacterized protein LOC120350047 [Nilaparvata lugens]
MRVFILKQILVLVIPHSCRSSFLKEMKETPALRVMTHQCRDPFDLANWQRYATCLSRMRRRRCWRGCRIRPVCEPMTRRVDKPVNWASTRWPNWRLSSACFGLSPTTHSRQRCRRQRAQWRPLSPLRLVCSRCCCLHSSPPTWVIASLSPNWSPSLSASAD